MGNLKNELDDDKVANPVYLKIWGLKELERMGFPVPAYEVVDIARDLPTDLNSYLSSKVEKVKIPCEMGDRIGVTIRVSMPGQLDKISKHGGLHVTEKAEILKRIVDRYRHYGPSSKIIIQHTVDARCSGAILKEECNCIVETILGDAPPLLEGVSTNYEKWVFEPTSGLWRKEKAYLTNNRELPVLTQYDRKKLENYLRLLPSSAYLEWSISKQNALFFYEYCKLQ